MLMDSSVMVYDNGEKSYVPKWRYDTDRNILHYYNERIGAYRTRTMIDKYIIDHMRYLSVNYPERIQKLLDSDNLYRYLIRKSRQAQSVVDRQVEIWQETDKEYRTAIETGDFKREIGLLNNLIARAEEIMYPGVIYA